MMEEPMPQKLPKPTESQPETPTLTEEAEGSPSPPVVAEAPAAVRPLRLQKRRRRFPQL